MCRFQWIGTRLALALVLGAGGAACDNVSRSGEDAPDSAATDLADLADTEQQQDTRDTAENDLVNKDTQPIDGSGECPTAVLKAKGEFQALLDAYEGPWRWRANVLDASLSTTSTGQLPAEFVFRVTPLEGQPTPRIVRDQESSDIAIEGLVRPGAYRVEMDVIDANGVTSCAPATLLLRFINTNGLTILLTWHTPSDPDESDTGSGAGTDLDLHFLRSGGFWEDRFGDSDVYLANAQGDWGIPGNDDDDASLDRDDTDGAGPETTTIRTPARTDGTSGANGYMSPYLVGVYFYDDWGFEGPTFATIEVFFDGEDVPSVVIPGTGPGREFRIGRPTGDADFWLVGEVHWTAAGGHFVPINQMLTGYPD